MVYWYSTWYVLEKSWKRNAPSYGIWLSLNNSPWIDWSRGGFPVGKNPTDIVTVISMKPNTLCHLSFSFIVNLYYPYLNMKLKCYNILLELKLKYDRYLNDQNL